MEAAVKAIAQNKLPQRIWDLLQGVRCKGTLVVVFQSDTLAGLLKRMSDHTLDREHFQHAVQSKHRDQEQNQ